MGMMPPSVRRLVLIAACISLTACGGIYRDHGYFPPPEDLEQIVVGIDTRDSVEETLGSAASGSVLGDDAMYFVRSRIRTVAMLEPQVIDRQVLAISFNEAGVVTNLETFGLERGQVVPLTRRVTSSGVRDTTFLRQLLGNIGRFTPGAADIDN
ncbi:outer membrane protein assembly factor BamE [Roseobacter sinensis]|uniref:Outer membrane protein assembly factor BamE n=1 Tax=Roseobacter sinensis TaxID=2931391 RepID=A0ABT3BGP0_9RHOB|nr:outer membrane protein assembly factor BamE [Roseobacter sp. WL0113]MCV3272333.1 outer membrane protein assembly factor BamE [Roseobacter sp. WL0113]